MNKVALLVFGLLAFAEAEAATVLYGRPANTTTLGNPSLPSGRLLVNTSNAVAPGGVYGNVLEWSVYGFSAGTVASVILTPLATGGYQVTGVDERVIQAGVNTFTTPAYTGSSAIIGGTLFGLWQQGCATPSADPLPTPPTGQPACTVMGGQVAGTNAGQAQYDTWGWSDNASLRNFTNPLDALNATIEPISLPVSQRVYSYQVKVEQVPAPATLWLLGSSLIGWFGITRRKALAA